MGGSARTINRINAPLTTDLTGWGKGLKQAANQVDTFYAGIKKKLAESPFGKAVKNVQDFGKGFTALSKSAVAPLAPIAKGIGSITKQAASGVAIVAKLGTGLVALGIAATAAVGAFSKGGFERIGEVGKQSLEIGIASDKLTELQFAAKASGASAEDLNTFLKGLNETVHSSIGVISPASEAFHKLGTSAEELTKLTPDKQFDKLKKGFDALPDAASKADAAVKIGGDAGLRLFKMLGMGAAEFEALKKKSKDSGFTVSPEDLAKVQAANAAWEELGAVFEGIQSKLTTLLAPAVSLVTGLFSDWLSGLVGDKQYLDDLVTAGVVGFGKLADTAVGISLVFRDVFAGIGEAIGAAISWVGSLLDAVARVVPAMQGVADGVKNIGKTVSDFGERQAESSRKAREAFEKEKPSEKIIKAYTDFTKATNDKAKATVKATEATVPAVTANKQLNQGVADLKQSFSENIKNSGFTEEFKQINALKGITKEERKELEFLAKASREAGKRDALAEDLRESTKMPFQKLQEDLKRINQLVLEGKITQRQALLGAAMKTQESGIAGGPVQFAGALQRNSTEGRSYILSQTIGRPQDALTVAKQGLSATLQGNSYLARIANNTGNKDQVVTMG